jgi:hypothetical protein
MISYGKGVAYFKTDYKSVVPKLFRATSTAPPGSSSISPVPPALPYIKHSLEQRCAQSTTEDNNNKIRYHIQ